MSSVFRFIGVAWDSIIFVLASDFQRFHNIFPRTYFLLFPLIRILPICAVIGWVIKKTALIRLKVNPLFHILYAVLSNEKILLFFILLFGFGVRIFFAITLPPIVSEGDAMCRIEIAATEYENMFSSIPGGLIWLPLHFYLMLIPRFFGLDSISSGILITLF
jgi:hypothetical protein